MRILRRLGRFVLKLARAVLAHPDAVLAACDVDPRIIDAARVAVALVDARSEQALDRQEAARRSVRSELVTRGLVGISDQLINTAIELALRNRKAGRE